MRLPARARAILARPGARQTVLFGLVGGTGAVTYFALNWMFVGLFGLLPIVALAITLVITIPPVYLVQRALTFRSDRPHRQAFPRYLATQLIGNSVSLLVANIFPLWMSRHAFIGSVLLTGCVVTTNFIVLKLWIFKPPAAQVAAGEP